MLGSGWCYDGLTRDYKPPGCCKSSWMYFRLKHLENLRKHGIGLADCEVIFDVPLATAEGASEAYGQQRLQSLGLFYPGSWDRSSISSPSGARWWRSSGSSRTWRR